MLKGIIQRLWYAICFSIVSLILLMLEWAYYFKIIEMKPEKHPIPSVNCKIITGTPIENGMGVDFSKLSGLIKQSGMTTQQFLKSFGSIHKKD